MNNKLEWNVYKEDVNGRIIKPYNVLSHYHFLNHIVNNVFKVYDDRSKKVAEELEATKDKLTTKKFYNLMKKKYDEINNSFLMELDEYCKYNFWGRCEQEVILCSWPNAITVEEFDRLKEEYNERKEKYPDMPFYRLSVNCYVEEKISVYDQLKLNFTEFANYIKRNEADIKKEFKRLKKLYNK